MSGTQRSPSQSLRKQSGKYDKDNRGRDRTPQGTGRDSIQDKKKIAEPTATEDSVLTVTKSIHITQPVVPNQIGKRAQVREDLSLLIQEAKTHQWRQVQEAKVEIATE